MVIDKRHAMSHNIVHLGLGQVQQDSCSVQGANRCSLRREVELGVCMPYRKLDGIKDSC